MTPTNRPAGAPQKFRRETEYIRNGSRITRLARAGDADADGNETTIPATTTAYKSINAAKRASFELQGSKELGWGLVRRAGA